MLALFGCAILLFDFLIFPDPRQRKWLLIFVVLAEGFTGFGLYRQQAYWRPGIRGAERLSAARSRWTASASSSTGSFWWPR